MKEKFSWHSEPGVAPHWYKIHGWLPNRYLPLVMFDSICIYKPSMKGGHTHNHVKNAHKRMKHCVICDKPITKYEGFSSRFIGHICMECYIEECREHAVMAGIPTIGSLFDDLRNPYIRRK